MTTIGDLRNIKALLEANMWIKKVIIGDLEVEFETGAVARQASGSVLVRAGKMVLLCTVTGSSSPRDGDFLPLTVLYNVRLAGAGIIPGGFFKREGRATEQEILISRIIDRSLRPLFPDHYRFDTQAVITLLSYDPEIDAGALALTGTAMALAISELPFDGPVAALRIGLKNGHWTFLPGFNHRAELDLDFIIAARREGIVMAEGCSREVSEQLALEAFHSAQQAMIPLFEAIEEARQALGQEKRSITAPEGPPEQLVNRVKDAVTTAIQEALTVPEKHPRSAALKAVEETLSEDFEDELDDAKDIFAQLKKNEIRHTTLAGRRVDGRATLAGCM